MECSRPEVCVTTFTDCLEEVLSDLQSYKGLETVAHSPDVTPMLGSISLKGAEREEAPRGGRSRNVVCLLLLLYSSSSKNNTDDPSAECLTAQILFVLGENKKENMMGIDVL